MAITQDMLRFSLTDTYDFENIIKGVQMKRYVDFIEQGKPLSVRSVNAFLDDNDPATLIFDKVFSKLSIGTNSDVGVVKHTVGLHRVVYDIFLGGYLFTMWASIVGNDDDDTYARFMDVVENREPKERAFKLREVRIEIYGHGPVVNEASDLLEAELALHANDKKRSVIRWRYTAGHSTESMLLSLEKNWNMHAEAYPWVTKPLNEYYADYTASSSSILICYGPPGTGKTSFIRDYLCEQQINALVSYDAGILASDEMFTFFLSSPAYDALIIEDADDMLTTDREGNNKMIAKLLNASDGLLKLPQKKVILSTNLENLSHIDEAIIRPGRCFDILNFRRLTRPEQVALCAKLNISANVDGEASLAEIYQASEESFRPKHKTMGFL